MSLITSLGMPPVPCACLAGSRTLCQKCGGEGHREGGRSLRPTDRPTDWASRSDHVVIHNSLGIKYFIIRYAVKGQYVYRTLYIAVLVIMGLW